MIGPLIGQPRERMQAGPTIIGRRRLPIQDSRKLLLMGERWRRAAAAHEAWATRAKEAVDYVEGRQWDSTVLRQMQAQKRPALTLNKIGPLVRLVLGYHINNKTETKIAPGSDMDATEEVGEALSKIVKQISIDNHQPFVDTAVFLDGSIGGRGYWDSRLNFERNDFGEIEIKEADPATIYLDPDGDQYDLDKCGFIFTRRWASPDEIEAYYGRPAADMLRPLAAGMTPATPVFGEESVNGEITPIRGFGHRDDGNSQWWDEYQGLIGDVVDPVRKSICLLDCQHAVIEPARVFVDLETGDRKRIPDHWTDEHIAKAVYFAESSGNPVAVDVRPQRRVRWTTIAGDMLIHDDWSPYDGYSLTGFFPWFRRGYSAGMVDDLIDPQNEVNKRTSAETEIIMKSGNGGWKYHEGSLDQVQERNLQRFGSTPGVMVKWRGDPAGQPTRIEPGTIPTGYDRLAEQRAQDLKEISGINDAALGQLDRVQSGRALEARQRQAVLAVQPYLENFKQSRVLIGRKTVWMIQHFYTEQRVFRVLGEDSRLALIMINRQILDPAGGAARIVNDVTRGHYNVTVTDTPLAATFEAAQFEETLAIVEKLAPIVPGQILADILVDMSSLPRKNEIRDRIRQALGIMPPGGAPMGGQPGTMAPSGPVAAPGPQLAGGVSPTGATVVPFQPKR